MKSRMQKALNSALTGVTVAGLVFGSASTTFADSVAAAFPFPAQADHVLTEFQSHYNPTRIESQESFDRLLSPTHSSLQEFCSKYTSAYEDTYGFVGCECKSDDEAILCWNFKESNASSIDYMFVFITYDAVEGKASGGGYCQCEDSSDCSRRFCFYVYDPVGTPTCSIYAGVNLQGLSCDTCRICNVTQSFLSFDFDECGFGVFGCLQVPLLIFGAESETPGDLAVDHSPQPIAFPPIGVPATVPPTTGPTMPPTRNGEDLLSISIRDPLNTLYSGNDVASCSSPNQTAIPYSRAKLECQFKDPVCTGIDCRAVRQFWDFNTIDGTLWSQSTCLGHDSICFHVAYDSDQSVATDCSVFYQWNGKTALIVPFVNHEAERESK